MLDLSGAARARKHGLYKHGLSVIDRREGMIEVVQQPLPFEVCRRLVASKRGAFERLLFDRQEISVRVLEATRYVMLKVER